MIPKPSQDRGRTVTQKVHGGEEDDFHPGLRLWAIIPGLSYAGAYCLGGLGSNHPLYVEIEVGIYPPNYKSYRNQIGN